MTFMSHFYRLQFYPFLLQHSGFINLSFHNFISKIPQCDTWCSYTPLQFHVLYTLSGWGVTAFITPHRLFCYNVMSFGLKNVGATYQRLVTKIFKLLLGKTIKVYIDDMLVKSKERPDHARHLQKAFKLLRAYGRKLNPSKCAYRVSAGRFLGFMVT